MPPAGARSLRLPYCLILVVIAMAVAVPVAVVLALVATAIVLHDHHAPVMPRVVLPVARRHHEHALGHATHVHRQPWPTPRRSAIPVAAAQTPPQVVRAEHVVVTAVVVDHVDVVHHHKARLGPD